MLLQPPALTMCPWKLCPPALTLWNLPFSVRQGSWITHLKILHLLIFWIANWQNFTWFVIVSVLEDFTGICLYGFICMYYLCSGVDDWNKHFVFLSIQVIGLLSKTMHRNWSEKILKGTDWHNRNLVLSKVEKKIPAQPSFHYCVCWVVLIIAVCSDLTHCRQSCHLWTRVTSNVSALFRCACW